VVTSDSVLVHALALGYEPAFITYIEPLVSD